MLKKGFFAGLLLLLTVGIAGAKEGQWLHVAVDGVGPDPERVRVNVPLQLVAAVLPLIEEEDFRRGKIRLDDAEFRHEDIVEILRAVRDAEDGEYLTIEDLDDIVRIAKRDDYIYIDVEEQGRRSRDHVEIKVPVAVLDALVSGDDDELDLLAAIEALGEHGEGDLVTVDDDGTTVRVWVDYENSPERGVD